MNGTPYSLSVTTCGDFGCYEQDLKILKDTNGKRAFLTITRFDGEKYHKETKQIAWDDAKAQLLAEVFLKGTKGDNGKGWCTNESVYKLYRFPYVVTFTDERCTFDDRLRELLQ